MILHCAEVAKADHWATHRDQIVASIRSRMETTAQEKGLTPGSVEVIEVTPMRFEERDNNVGYFSCDFDDATHVKVQIERDLEEQ